MKIQFIYPTLQQSQYSPMFNNAIFSFIGALRRLGLQVIASPGVYVPDVPAILIGPHLFPVEFVASLPRNTMIYNMELMGDVSNGLVNKNYVDLIKEFIVLDYGNVNMEFWRRNNAQRVIEVPIGYDPALERMPAREVKDIDVLFMGSMSQRRLNVIQKIADRGYKVVHAFGIYGDYLDELISRTKLVMNIHFFEVGGIETLRLSYLWANKVPVICECKLLNECPEDLQKFMRRYSFMSDYDRLVEDAVKMLTDESLRVNSAAHAYEGFVKSFDLEPVLANMINVAAEMAI